VYKIKKNAAKAECGIHDAEKTVQEIRVLVDGFKYANNNQDTTTNVSEDRCKQNPNLKIRNNSRVIVLAV
jgi:hypothetical protein